MNKRFVELVKGARVRASFKLEAKDRIKKLEDIKCSEYFMFCLRPPSYLQKYL
jgi:hypothetical protein